MTGICMLTVICLEGLHCQRRAAKEGEGRSSSIDLDSEALGRLLCAVGRMQCQDLEI